MPPSPGMLRTPRPFIGEAREFRDVVFEDVGFEQLSTLNI